MSPESVLKFFQTALSELAPKILASVVILVIGKILSSFLQSAIKRTMKIAKIDETLISFSVSFFSLFFMFLILLMALSQMGVETTSFIAILGSAGLAVGLALQDSLKNLASGILILVFRPFSVSHYIESGSVSGTVEEIHILSTRLKTPDNRIIFVPNATFTGSSIINYSLSDKRRVDLVIGVSYSDSLDKVKKVLEEEIAKLDLILKDPVPLIAVSELAQSSVNFVVRPWVKSSDFFTVKFELTKNIKNRFDQEGITIPFPQQTVHIHHADSDSKQS